MSKKILALILLLLLMGCGNVLNNSNKSKLTIGITDAPINSAESVNITFTKIEIATTTEAGDEWSTYFEGNQVVDLLNFQNGKIFNFPDNELKLGNYGQVRLFLGSDAGDNTIVIDSKTYELNYNKGVANSGLKLVGGFTLADGVDTSLTIDFDVRKSIVVKGGSKNPTYNLKPTIKLIQTNLTGNILISNAEINTTYYIYNSDKSVTGEELTTDENGDSIPYLNAIQSAISYTEDTKSYVKLAFVPYGTYKLYKGVYENDTFNALEPVKILENDAETVSISSNDNAEVNYTIE